MSGVSNVKPCCLGTIGANRDAGFCGSCGAPLLRCHAFEECSGLVGRDGVCQACVSPALDIDPSAVKDARVGSVLSLPLMLQNTSPAGRPIFVTGLWVRTGDEDRRATELLWERLDAGAAAPMPVRTSVLGQSGTHRVEIAFVVETRFRWRTESYLFASSLEVNVEGDQASTVHQTINLTADTIEPGATVYAPVRQQGNSGTSAPTKADLQIVHAERLELDMGLRGVDNRWRLPRNVPLNWVGFPEGEAPPDGRMSTEDGVLALGRSRTKQQSGTGDVWLLARQGNGVDEELSLMISRRHCELFVQNDRLMIRAESNGGLLVNGDYLSRGDEAVIRPGTTVAPLRDYPEALALRFDITQHHGTASNVTVTRLAREQRP